MPLVPSRPSKDTPAAAPKQRSRKGKKAWRKNIDLNDIETGLENSRADERLGGGKLHERANEALFQIDTGGDDKGMVVDAVITFNDTS
ncbi:Ribosome biogenesis protein NOP53 [Dimargaris verticillata]|uniref:Ribosome biogenesis protein NOP53 n=1 Tax=Dimargaris verticillata TaxID=2761393 RepID=A0A9W8BAJ7_9FUNG|nr:Ribosome biogenesis protein NOP53 [Dimargaris verticillata]